jgi:hypothetical protein
MAPGEGVRRSTAILSRTTKTNTARIQALVSIDQLRLQGVRSHETMQLRNISWWLTIADKLNSAITRITAFPGSAWVPIWQGIGG